MQHIFCLAYVLQLALKTLLDYMQIKLTNNDLQKL